MLLWGTYASAVRVCAFAYVRRRKYKLTNSTENYMCMDGCGVDADARAHIQWLKANLN